MRKITNEAVKAFYNGENFRLWNTEVKHNWNIAKMYLHGNLIATKQGNNIWISGAGCRTNTTKERINWVLWYFTDLYVYQKKFNWYVWAIHMKEYIAFDIWNEFDNVIIF